MKMSDYKSYDELPLFLNAELVAKVLGVSLSSGYELMHEPGFPVLKVGNRMVVPICAIQTTPRRGPGHLPRNGRLSLRANKQQHQQEGSFALRHRNKPADL